MSSAPIGLVWRTNMAARGGSAQGTKGGPGEGERPRIKNNKNKKWSCETSLNGYIQKMYPFIILFH